MFTTSAPKQINTSVGSQMSLEIDHPTGSLSLSLSCWVNKSCSALEICFRARAIFLTSDCHLVFGSLGLKILLANPVADLNYFYFFPSVQCFVSTLVPMPSTYRLLTRAPPNLSGGRARKMVTVPRIDGGGRDGKMLRHPYRIRQQQQASSIWQISLALKGAASKRESRYGTDSPLLAHRLVSRLHSTVCRLAHKAL